MFFETVALKSVLRVYFQIKSLAATSLETAVYAEAHFFSENDDWKQLTLKEKLITLDSVSRRQML